MISFCLKGILEKHQLIVLSLFVCLALQSAQSTIPDTKSIDYQWRFLQTYDNDTRQWGDTQSIEYVANDATGKPDTLYKLSKNSVSGGFSPITKTTFVRGNDTIRKQFTYYVQKDSSFDTSTPDISVEFTYESSGLSKVITTSGFREIFSAKILDSLPAIHMPFIRQIKQITTESTEYTDGNIIRESKDKIATAPAGLPDSIFTLLNELARFDTSITRQRTDFSYGTNFVIKAISTYDFKNQQWISSYRDSLWYTSSRCVSVVYSEYSTNDNQYVQNYKDTLFYSQSGRLDSINTLYRAVNTWANSYRVVRMYTPYKNGITSVSYNIPSAHKLHKVTFKVDQTSNHLLFYCAEQSTIQTEILNLSGQCVAKYHFMYPQGSHSLPLNSIPAGYYLINLKIEAMPVVVVPFRAVR